MKATSFITLMVAASMMCLTSGQFGSNSTGNATVTVDFSKMLQDFNLSDVAARQNFFKEVAKCAKKFSNDAMEISTKARIAAGKSTQCPTLGQDVADKAAIFSIKVSAGFSIMKEIIEKLTQPMNNTQFSSNLKGDVRSNATSNVNTTVDIRPVLHSNLRNGTDKQVCFKEMAKNASEFINKTVQLAQKAKDAVSNSTQCTNIMRQISSKASEISREASDAGTMISNVANKIFQFFSRTNATADAKVTLQVQ